MIVPFRGIAPTVGAGAFVAPNASVIGDVVLGARASVWFSAVLRGDDAPIRVGDESNIQDGAVVHVLERDGVRTPCVVGHRVTIGHGVILHSCTIGDGSIVGMGSTVMDGAEVGPEVFVGAGSLVPPGARLPPRTLVVGSPARVKRDLRPDEIKWLGQSAAHYVMRTAQYLAEAWTQPGGPAGER